MERSQVLSIFKQTESMLSGHFVLASGRHSDTYMQCAKLFVDPSSAHALCKALADKLSSSGIEADYVVSPAVGGIIMGYQMAQIMGTKNLFYERQEGVMTLRRGFVLPKSSRVLVVEDVVTTGGSVKEVVSQVTQSGSIVAAVASIVDRSGGKAEFGCPYFSLLEMDIETYPNDNCPLCAQGTPAVKPGSSGLKQGV